MYKCLLVSILCAGCGFAQIETAPPGGQKMTVQMGGPVQFGDANFFYEPLGDAVPPVAGAPYSAQSTTQRVQVLADGNRIEQDSSSTVARDNQGRVRTERIMKAVTLPTGDPARLITIDDPVGGYNYTLDSNSKTAFRFVPGKSPLFAAARTKMETAVTEGPGKEVRIFRTQTTTGKPPEGNEVKADLGTQTMEGVLVQGTRMTRTIPAGSIGNEQPIVITTETWFSPDLKVLVMSRSDDPRIGETTYKLTNIQRGEPSAALFQIPADYTMKDGPGPLKTFFIAKPGSNDQPQ